MSEQTLELQHLLSTAKARLGLIPIPQSWLDWNTHQQSLTQCYFVTCNFKIPDPKILCCPVLACWLPDKST